MCNLAMTVLQVCLVKTLRQVCHALTMIANVLGCSNAACNWQLESATALQVCYAVTVLQYVICYESPANVAYQYLPPLQVCWAGTLLQV